MTSQGPDPAAAPTDQSRPKISLPKSSWQPPPLWRPFLERACRARRFFVAQWVHSAASSPKGDSMSDRMTLPVLPLRDAVLFPGVASPIGAGRPATLRAIEAALKDPERRVFAVAPKGNVDQVSPAVPYTTATIAAISQPQRTPGGVRLVVGGGCPRTAGAAHAPP